MNENRSTFAISDAPPPGTFEAIYAALEASSVAQIGPARPRLLVIPIRDDNGSVAGGLWGYTMFEWLHVQMLFVPQPLRGIGVGAALMGSAEAEARERGCRGAYVDTFSFQAAPFYQRIGFALFGKLDDCPPGHDRLFFYKRFDAAPAIADTARRRSSGTHDSVKPGVAALGTAPQGVSTLGVGPLGMAPPGVSPPGGAPPGSAPLGSAPPGSAPLGSASLRSAPLGGASLRSAPLGGASLRSAPLGGASLRSAPLSGAP